MLEVTNLEKIYKSSGFRALEGISFKAAEGEIFGFVGPNGAGKSTTIKCITGILQYEVGNIRVGGFEMSENPIEAKKLIGYVPDTHDIYEGITGEKYVNFIADAFNVPKSRRLELINKYAVAFGLENKLGEKISTYSHGMKQKINLMAALVHEPRLLILDEPMTGLDPQSSFQLKTIMTEMTNAGNTVFFSSHILEVVEKICHKIAVINKGKIVFGCSIAELKEHRGDASLESIFLSLTAV